MLDITGEPREFARHDPAVPRLYTTRISAFNAQRIAQTPEVFLVSSGPKSC